MTEYEKLKEEIRATAAGYTSDIKALTTRLMTIIADKCWLKDTKQEKALESVHPWRWYGYWSDGWRPVVEIKKEGKGV